MMLCDCVSWFIFVVVVVVIVQLYHGWIIDQQDDATGELL